MNRRIIGLHSPAPQSGKSTIARHLEARGFTVVPFAKPLKTVARSVCQQLGWIDGAIDTMLSGDKTARVYRDVTMRRLLQTLGTDWGRTHLGPDVWVDCWRAANDNHPGDLVADDVRFPNEAQAIRALGGKVWCVLRPGAEGAGTHASEAGLDPSLIDMWIPNNGTVVDLLRGVDTLLEVTP